MAKKNTFSQTASGHPGPDSNIRKLLEREKRMCKDFVSASYEEQLEAFPSAKNAIPSMLKCLARNGDTVVTVHSKRENMFA
jgi:hypothetical protein